MRIEQITFTRFLAAISIVVYHYGKNIFPFNNKNISFAFDQANIGVSYFFILSGFVMIFAYGRRPDVNIAEYFKSRFARIYPVYLLAIILILIHYILNQQQIDSLGLFLNTLVIQAWIPAKAISFNPPGWSLTIEFFFYVIFPFLLKHIYNRHNYRKLLIPIIFIWFISQVVFHMALSSGFYEGYLTDSHNLLFYLPVMHLNEFLAGNIAGLYFISKDKKTFQNYDWILLMIVIILFLLLKYPLGLNYHNGLLAVLFVPFILFLSLNTGKITLIFNKKSMIFLGEISYGIYILQYPVFMWVRSALKILHIHNPILIFYISVVLLIIISGISYQFIEAPLRNKIKNLRLRRVESVVQ